MILAFVGINLICLLVILKKVKEPPAASSGGPFHLLYFVRSFWIDPHAPSDFYWVLKETT